MRTNWSPLPDALSPADRRLIEKLRGLKDDSRLTLTELGAKTHYSASSWERWLNGKRPITRSALLSIADAMSVDAGPLLDLLDLFDEADMAGPAEEVGAADAADAAGEVSGNELPVAAMAMTAVIAPAPAQLPRDLPDYVGREQHINTLIAGLRDPNREFVPVWGIVGMGGLGKTSLAVRAAHRLAPFYPGGTLFLDLRGGGAEPLDADAALLRLLRSAGVEDSTIPTATDDRSALLRSTLSKRRMLIVLDNVFDAAQVRPLLPGNPGCGVIITSRNQLAGLEGVQRIFLDALSAEESRSLLAHIAGTERFDAEPDGSDDLLSICAGLPLALRIAGSRLAVRPNWAVRTLSDRLRSAAQSLDELAVDDLAVRACFESSYNTLIVDDVELGGARALRLLGLWEGPEISLPAAAALLDMTVEAAERELERLTDISLVQSPAPRRYRFHDLLHSFVSERARLDLTAADQRAAIARLGSWYAHVGAAASVQLSEGQNAYDLTDIAQPVLDHPFDDSEDALRWYDTESPALVAITRQAQKLHLDDIAARLPQIFQVYMEFRFKLSEWVDVASQGLVSARRLGSPLLEAQLQTTLATAYCHAGRHDRAMAHSRDGMALYEQAGDFLSQAHAMEKLAIALELAGEIDEARTWLTRAIATFESSDHLYAAASGLNRLGMMCNEAGLAEEAVIHLERCLDLVTHLNSRGAQAATHSNLGQAYLKVGQRDKALAAHLTAHQLFIELDHEPGQATNLAMMGDFFRTIGRTAKALQCYTDSLVLLEKVGHPVAGEVRQRMNELAAPLQVR